MAIQKPKGAKPKIAILSRNFSKGAGGAENYAVNLVEQLADEFEFHVFSCIPTISNLTGNSINSFLE